MKRCLNKRCNEELEPLTHDWFCPSCKLIGRTGLFLGGVIVGATVAILKLMKVL